MKLLHEAPLACWRCTVTLRSKVALKSSTHFTLNFPAEAKPPSCSLTCGRVTLQFIFLSVFVTYQSHAFCRQRFNYDFTLLNNVRIAELQFSSRSLYINVCKYNQKPSIRVLRQNPSSKSHCDLSVLFIWTYWFFLFMYHMCLFFFVSVLYS